MIKGVDPDEYDTLNDLDGTYSAQHVSGKALREGLTFRRKTRALRL